MESNQIWTELKRCLPYRNTPEQTQKRKQLWSMIDVNNNGYLSLAQVDKGLRDVIGIPKLFDTKPVILRAFQAAKNKVKATNPHGPDYVSRVEWRYMLSYLRQYYEYWLAFDRIDKDDDRRITLDEFKKSLTLMSRWNLKVADPEHVFKQIDKNGGGFILFDQFCQWAIKQNLDLDDDDDAQVL